MIVCICNRLNHRQIREALDTGARSVREVHDHWGVTTQCGKCADFIVDEVDSRDAARDTATRLAAQ